MLIIIYSLIAVLALAVFAAVLFVILRRRNRRSSAPRVTTPAVVIGKRSHTARDVYCKTCAVQPGEVSTTYYATFCLESGELVELVLPHRQSDEISEGDHGMLTFQGSGFLGFERT